jgi:hypothetical protein
MKLTPQEKKRLSYQRDGRNTYGENDKASRKAIPLRKRLRARAVRRKTREQLPADRTFISDEELETMDAHTEAADRSARNSLAIPAGEPPVAYGAVCAYNHPSVWHVAAP